MVKPRLILVLADQRSLDLTALQSGDPTRDVVVMAEVMSEANYVKHHKKKVVLILSAMRKFADALRDAGWTVAYSKLDDPLNSQSISAELLRYADSFKAEKVIFTEPGEFRLIDELSQVSLMMEMVQDARFIASHSEFELWAKGRKLLRMEYFYREMRKKTGLLMDQGQPEGGKWNYDSDNRKPAKTDMLRPAPLRFDRDEIVQDVCDMVDAILPDHPGRTDNFWFATDAAGANEVLEGFLKDHLKDFGDYQDAMLQGDRFLHHSLLSAYINIGLLDAMEVCRRAEDIYRKGNAPLNAVEGFIRQIIGWREYMRGIYFREGRNYTLQNALGGTRALPEFFWTGRTDMNCMSQAIEQTLDEAYAHHIQRLMLIGNFALLAGLEPYEVHKWYLAIYWDAFEWVEAPNVIGMSQFADGGIIASKPYVSSGAYIDRMSDYCKSCAYSVKIKLGEGACPFNLLYWDFLDRHEERFGKNPRMAQIYNNWRKRRPEDRNRVKSDAKAFLDALV